MTSDRFKTSSDALTDQIAYVWVREAWIGMDAASRVLRILSSPLLALFCHI